MDKVTTCNTKAYFLGHPV